MPWEKRSAMVNQHALVGGEVHDEPGLRGQPTPGGHRDHARVWLKARFDAPPSSKGSGFKILRGGQLGVLGNSHRSSRLGGLSMWEPRIFLISHSPYLRFRWHKVAAARDEYCLYYDDWGAVRSQRS